MESGTQRKHQQNKMHLNSGYLIFVVLYLLYLMTSSVLTFREGASQAAQE